MLRISPNCSNLLVVGDFNADLFVYFIVCPTFVTCIDHIYTNSFSPFVSGVLTEPLADHFPIFSEISLLGRRESDKISIQFRDISRNSIESFRDDLYLFFLLVVLLIHFLLRIGSKFLVTF